MMHSDNLDYICYRLQQYRLFLLLNKIKTLIHLPTLYFFFFFKFYYCVKYTHMWRDDMGREGGGGVQDGEHVYTYGGCMLMYGKTNTLL